MGRQSRFEHLSTNTGDALFFFFFLSRTYQSGSVAKQQIAWGV